MSLTASIVLVFLSTVASAVFGFLSLSVCMAVFTPGARPLGGSLDAAMGLFINGWWYAAAVGAVVGLVSGLVVSIILDGLPVRPVRRTIPVVSILVGAAAAPFLLAFAAIPVFLAQLLAAWALRAKLLQPRDAVTDQCDACGCPLIGLRETTRVCPECGSSV